MTVIAFDTARHREAGQIIMYGKEVGETFQPGEEVIVVCEVRPAGSLPADGPEPLSDDEKIPCTVRNAQTRTHTGVCAHFYHHYCTH